VLVEMWGGGASALGVAASLLDQCAASVLLNRFNQCLAQLARLAPSSLQY
jgi:hypothetical protein